MTRVRHKLAFLMISLFSIVFTLAVAEFGLQLYEDNRTRALMRSGSGFWEASASVHRKSKDADLVYELVPSSETIREGVHIKINTAGFRDDEWAKHEGQKVVILGDSVAWGWGVEMSAAFPQLLERSLRDTNVPPPVVYNMAVDGYSTEQELRLLETRGMALQPDVVIINYVLNDPDTRDGGLARYYTSEFKLQYLARRAWNRIRQFMAADADLNEYHQLIHAYGKEEIAERFRRLGKIGIEHDVTILVAVTPVFRFQPGEPYGWQNIHDFVEQLCIQNELLFLDLTKAFEGESSSKHAFDQWHPTESGHARIAEVLASFVMNEILVNATGQSEI